MQNNQFPAKYYAGFQRSVPNPVFWALSRSMCFSNAIKAMRIIKLNLYPVPVRLHSGYGKLIFVIISPFFAIFKNVVHSLESGETPSYSASHQAPNYAQRS